MSCGNYDNCIDKKRCDLRHPVDKRSLYSGRIYDNQTANRRCYENNPIEIVEGFGCPSKDLIKLILKWTIIGLIVYVVGTMIMGMNKSSKEITLNVETPSPAMEGGMTEFIR